MYNSNEKFFLNDLWRLEYKYLMSYISQYSFQKLIYEIWN